jgi:thiol-disulfide isomerase/thioredoxin
MALGRLRDAVLVAFLVLIPLQVPAAHPGEGDASRLWYAPNPEGRREVHLYFFWSESCPHCTAALPVVEDLAATYPWLRLHSLEVSQSRENAERFERMSALFGLRAVSVPTFMFCGNISVGWDSKQGTGRQLEEALLECNRQLGLGKAPLLGAAESALEQPRLEIPVLGEVEPGALSLPVFTLTIAALDAFNPCAFFILLFLLSLLVHARSRARILAVGGIFVFFSGLVYFLFMATWLNLFLLMGRVRLVSLVAGTVAIAMALVNIKDFFWFRRGVSLTIPESAKPGLFDRMRRLLHAESPLTLLAGTVVLATAANSYELLCTAGLPMVFTRVLTLSELPTSTYYVYLLLYNVVYVLPLLLIVLTFTYTLGSRKLTELQGRTLKLLSGLMMLGLGGILVLQPALLNNVWVAIGLLAGALILTTVLRRARVAYRYSAG